MKYEIMFIVNPNLEESVLKNTVLELEKIINGKDSKIINSKNMGQKELAYEIKKHKSGYYYVYQIDVSDKKIINEFNRLASLNENVLRHMVVKLED